MLLRVQTGLEQLNDRGVVGRHVQLEYSVGKRRDEKLRIKPETEDETEDETNPDVGKQTSPYFQPHSLVSLIQQSKEGHSTVLRLQFSVHII